VISATLMTWISYLRYEAIVGSLLWVSVLFSLFGFSIPIFIGEKKGFYKYLWPGFFSALALAFGMAALFRLNEIGFEPRRLELVTATPSGDCHVLWLGERAVVLRCQKSTIQVSYQRSGLVFQMDPSRRYNAPRVSLPPDPRKGTMFFGLIRSPAVPPEQPK
jgi:hypothetical protein